MPARWSFAIDVGGTFTDCLAAAPDGTTRVHKVLSTRDAPLVAIREVLGLAPTGVLPSIDVRLGTTRGTNALLTRRGARVALVTTGGLADVLAIGTQERPKLFELAIRKRPMLYERVIEIDERVAADGRVIVAPDVDRIRAALDAARRDGIEALAICLLHAHAHPAHERIVAAAARAVGFADVRASSEVAPLEKIVARGETTVLDAYLDPVLRAYVASLGAALGAGSTLRVMTSAGGLVDATRFSGKDSVLSGPAGGAVGVAAAARAFGIDRALGLDMGGTSTDVCRWDGRDGAFEMEYEAEKAGVRIVSPAIAIETVAAGGGSICAFDGARLTVGPDSAGADPGPACYGRGGPLTLTDVNLLCGRILAERFPFPLDRAAAERRLAELGGDDAMLRGFIAVADAAMVRAIRSVSVARGADPAEHTLVCFGGAGPQHACAVAAELGIRDVLVPARASVLSAQGIALADARRHREQSVLAPLDGAPGFEELAELARADLRADGVEATETHCSLDLRYDGVEDAITVPRPADGDWRAAYERMHERRFGYRHEGRGIQVVAMRVEAVARSAGAWPPRGGVARVIDGPALLPGASTSIVVAAGWRARVYESGDVRLEHVEHVPRVLGGAPDPATLEIFHHHFASVAERMGFVLRRTACSTNVKERLDFSCALFTPSGDLVVNAPHVPVHLGAMSETVRALLPELRDGDVIATNDPYRGGSHLPDVTVVTPVFHDGALAFVVASRAHHAEIGGVVPGSMPAHSRSLAEEGVLLRGVRVVVAGTPRLDELGEILRRAPYPSRRIDDNLADLAAQIAANQAGAVALRELIARHGASVVAAHLRAIPVASAARMRRALARLPKGRRVFEDHLDDGTPIRVAITLEGARAIVDFAGTGPVVPGNLNANRAIVTAAVLYSFRALLDEDVPIDAGMLEPIELRIPAGSLLDPPWDPDPSRCPAVTGGNVETSQRLVDVILGALGLAAASQGTMNNVAFGDGSFGYYETLCGGAGATRDADGADAVHTHMTNTRLTDPEVLERRYPVRVVRFAIRRGSGGRGARRGGDGVVRELELVSPVQVSILSERRGPYPPYGLAGGAPGAFGRNAIVRAATGIAEELPAKATFDAGSGDRLVIETPGGGGWG